MAENNTNEKGTASSGGTVVWFLIGVAVGATAAILLAPHSGRDTREFLTRKTQEGRDAVGATGRDIVDRGLDFFDRSRQLVDDAADLFERGRKLVRG